jgi:hypothetical protein
MRRVLAVLISVLTAVWPLLLPQPVSANPCGVTGAEGLILAQIAGHYVNQSGSQTSSATSAAGGPGSPGFDRPTIAPHSGTVLNVPIAANVNLAANKAKANGNSDGGDGGYANATSGNAGGQGSSANGGSGGNGTGGNGGASVPVAVGGVQVPVGGSGNGSLNGNGNGNGSGNGVFGGDANGAVDGNGNGDGSGNASARQGGTATAWAGDANGAKGVGGDADGGTSRNSASSGDAWGGSANGGNGGDRTTLAFQKNDLDAKNKDNSPYSGAVNTTLTGTGGNGGNSTASAGANTQGSRTAEVAPATATASFSASGDPCKQVIKNATGVLAVNGNNYITNTVMQNATAQFGNASNMAVNPAAGLLPAYEGVNLNAAIAIGSNVNINPNNNQNANIITIAPGQ